MICLGEVDHETDGVGSADSYPRVWDTCIIAVKKNATERRRRIRAPEDGGVGSLVVRYSDLRNRKKMPNISEAYILAMSIVVVGDVLARRNPCSVTSPVLISLTAAFANTVVNGILIESDAGCCLAHMFL